MLNSAGNCSLASTQATFAPADNTLISFDLHEHLVRDPEPDWVGNDCSDLKLCSHLCLRSHRNDPPQSSFKASSVAPSKRWMRSWSNSSQICSSGAMATLGGTLMLTTAPDSDTCTKVTSPVGSTV